MKAAILYGNENIRFGDYETPPLRLGTVKVRVRAVGICGSDVPRVLHHGAHFYPVVLGHEFAGDVVEVAEDVEGISVGDTVSGAPLVPCLACENCQQGNYALCRHYSFIGSREQGAFAEYVVLPARNAIRYDAAIPYEQAAMFEPMTVALHAVFLNDISPAETVAVLGCGTIGIFAVQWAKIFGARKVVAFDIDAGRLSLARALGADEAINTLDADFMAKAMRLTGGGGFSSVYETAGNTATMRYAFALAANRAHVCFIGTPHTDLTFSPAEWECMNRKEFRLTGSWMSYSAPFPGKEWGLTAEYFSKGLLKFDDQLIFRRFPLERADEAFQLYKKPEDVHGKVMLIV